MGKNALGLIMVLVFTFSFVSAWNFEKGDISVTTYTGNLTNFTNLQDTPNSYSGSASKCVVVNAGENSLSFGNCSDSAGDITAVNTNDQYLSGGCTSGACSLTFVVGSINGSDINNDLAWNNDSGGSDGNASSICSGTTTYLDGEGNCDDISSVYFDSEGDITCTSISGLSADLCDGSDADTTYTAGSNLSLSGTVFSANMTSMSNYFDTLFQDDIGADCSAGQFVKGIDDDGTLDCDSPSENGDITDVQGDNTYIYNGSVSGDVQLAFNVTAVLNYLKSYFIELTDSFGGEVSGTYDSIILDNDALDDQYIELTDLPLANQTLVHCSNITGGTDGDYCTDAIGGEDGNASSICSGDTTYLSGAGNCNDISSIYEVQLNDEAGLYAVLSDVTQFYEVGDKVGDADTLDTHDSSYFQTALTDEASLYSALSDVTQFYESGDDIVANNVTSIDCIVFDSGGKICSG